MWKDLTYSSAEPVCYKQRVSGLGIRVVEREICNADSDEIFKRFNTKEDVNLMDLLSEYYLSIKIEFLSTNVLNR